MKLRAKDRNVFWTGGGDSQVDRYAWGEERNVKVSDNFF